MEARLGGALHGRPAGGHCVYRSLAHQLRAQGDADCDFLACRRQIAGHMRAHASDFVPFLAESGAPLLLGAPGGLTGFSEDLVDGLGDGILERGAVGHDDE